MTWFLLALFTNIKIKILGRLVRPLLGGRKMKVSKKELDIFKRLKFVGISKSGAENIIKNARVMPCMDALYFVKLDQNDKMIFQNILGDYQSNLHTKISEVFYL